MFVLVTYDNGFETVKVERFDSKTDFEVGATAALRAGLKVEFAGQCNREFDLIPVTVITEYRALEKGSTHL